MLVKTLLPFVVAALAVSAAPLASADKAPHNKTGHGKAPAKNASGPHLPVQPPVKVAVGPRSDIAAAGAKGKGGKGSKKSKHPKPVTHDKSVGPASPPSPAPIVNHVSRDEDGDDNDDNDDNNDGSSEAEAKKEKQAPFPFNMAPAPAQHAVEMIPRQSKPDVPPKPEESLLLSILPSTLLSIPLRWPLATPSPHQPTRNPPRLQFLQSRPSLPRTWSSPMLLVLPCLQFLQNRLLLPRTWSSLMPLALRTRSTMRRPPRSKLLSRLLPRSPRLSWRSPRWWLGRCRDVSD